MRACIALLPNVGSIKIPAGPADPEAARQRVARLRALVPDSVTLGISGDASAATGLNAGCEAWYSAMGGLFPDTAMAIARAARAGDADEAVRLSARLQPLWLLFGQYRGSLRVLATAAELLALVESPCLPLPIQTLDATGRRQVAAALAALELA